MSLAELLIRHACGLAIPTLTREQSAAGAMMLPIPHAGFLQRVEGLDSALSIPGIEDIAITAKPAEKLLPFPEGASYPGFIFARGTTPQDVEQALRTAYRQLRLVIAPALELL
jgi:L-amino acid ligase C-terminal domain 2